MKLIYADFGWEYDNTLGYPAGGISPGIKLGNIAEEHEYPLCKTCTDRGCED